MSTTVKIHHTGAEWLAIDLWIKAEQEEKGVRGPKTIAAEAEARAVYKAARQGIKPKMPIEVIRVHPNAHLEPKAPLEPKTPVELKAPIKVKAPVKLKASLAPPPIAATVTRHKVGDSEAKLATLGVVAGLKATKNSWLHARRAEIMAKMAPRIKKVDLSGLDDWVDPTDPYHDCDYESP